MSEYKSISELMEAAAKLADLPNFTDYLKNFVSRATSFKNAHNLPEGSVVFDFCGKVAYVTPGNFHYSEVSLVK